MSQQRKSKRTPGYLMPIYMSSDVQEEAQRVERGRRKMDNRLYALFVGSVTKLDPAKCVFASISLLTIALFSGPLIVGLNPSDDEALMLSVYTFVSCMPLISLLGTQEKKNIVLDGQREYFGAKLVQTINDYNSLAKIWNQALQDQRINYYKIPRKMYALGETLHRKYPFMVENRQLSEYLLEPRAKNRARPRGFEDLPSTVAQSEKLTSNIQGLEARLAEQLEEMRLFLDAHSELKALLSNHRKS